MNPFAAVETKLANAGVIEGQPAQAPGPKAKVKLVSVLSELAEQVGMILGRDPSGLIPGEPKLFMRGETVMQIKWDPNQEDLDFSPMRETQFVTWVEQHITFVKFQGYQDAEGENQTRELKMSINTKIAKLILDSPQFQKCLPQVVRKNRVRLPIMRKGGKVELLPEGWDEESGIYTFPSKVVIDEGLPVEDAISFFLSLLSEFPLPLVTIETPGGKVLRQCPRGIAACITAMMAPFAEGLLPPQTLRCGFIATANQPRSGKSLLMKMAIAPITGNASGLTLSRDDEALRGQIDSVLLTGQSCLFFDNVKGYIESHVIEALMTLTKWEGRLFHTQQRFCVKNETTIFISGNNASVSPDINGRFVYIELLMETADPNSRKLSREINDRWLMDTRNRSDIVSALWAFTRYWLEQGRPGVPVWLAGFKDWSDIIGGIVYSVAELSCGTIGNPLAQPELSVAGDKEGKSVRKLIELLVEGKASTSLEFTAADLIETSMKHGLFDWFMPELPEGKEVNDVLKQPERVRFGKLMTAKSGEAPRGMKYLVTTQGKPALWRFSFKGGGRDRRYLLDRD